MTEVVFAKIKWYKEEIYFAGRSLGAIREELTDWDDPSSLVQVTEAEVRNLQYFHEAKSVAELGEVYSIGTRNCINYNRYIYLFSIFIYDRN